MPVQQKNIIASKVEVGVPTYITDLVDVTVTSPIAGSYLIYDTTVSKWVNDVTLKQTSTGATLTGDLDISQDLSVGGNLSVGAVTASDLTLNGITLSERIADTVGNMITNNSELGITVTYDDNDNTLDFNVGEFDITLTGDVSGSGTVTNLSNVSIATTIQSDSVELGTDTTGDYVKSFTAGSGLYSTGATSGESIDHTLQVNLFTVDTESLIEQGDYLIMTDSTDNGTGKITFGNLEDTIFGNVSGDINIAATGVATIQSTSVENAMLVNDSISFGGVELSLGGSNATPAFDLTNATNYPATSLTGSVSDSNITTSSITQHEASLSIATTQLTGTITNAQLAGSISNDKLVDIGNDKLVNSSISVTDGTNTTDISLGSTLTFSGTANEVDVSESSGTVTFGLPNDVTIGNDLTVTNDLTVNGDLSVIGTTTTVNTSILQIVDKNIELGVVTGASDSTADGGGLTLHGTTDKTFNWVDATDSWTSSENLDLASGKTYKINGTDILSETALDFNSNEVLNETTLGSTVINSSLTGVGTIATGTWQGDQIADAYIASAVAWNGKQDALTFGKSSGNALKSEEALTTDDVLLMGTSDVKGRTYAEFKGDLDLNNVENKSSATIISEITESDIPSTITRDTELSAFTGSANIATVGVLTSGSIGTGFGNINVGETNTIEAGNFIVAEKISHDSDADTFIEFAADRLTVDVGNVEMIDIVQNDTGDDVIKLQGDEVEITSSLTGHQTSTVVTGAQTATNYYGERLIHTGTAVTYTFAATGTISGSDVGKTVTVVNAGTDSITCDIASGATTKFYNMIAGVNADLSSGGVSRVTIAKGGLAEFVVVDTNKVLVFGAGVSG